MSSDEIVIEDKGEKRRRVAVAIAFFSEVIRFIIIPLLLVNMIVMYFPGVDPLLAQSIASNLMLFGSLLAVFVALETYFPNKSALKMVFGMLAIATLCVWFWQLLNAREIRFSYERASVAINVVGLSTIILFAVALKGVLPVARYLTARRAAKQKAEIADSARAPYVAPPVMQAPVRKVTPAPKSPSDEPPPPEDFKVKCPVCKSEISPSDDICPKCGAWIRRKV